MLHVCPPSLLHRKFCVLIAPATALFALAGSDGYLEIANKPGLGIELNEDVCRAHLVPGSLYFE